jgi:hypothetical protein
VIRRSICATASASFSRGAGRIHLAAHSHHFWSTRHAAHRRALRRGAARRNKWEAIFGDLVAARHCRHLALPDPATIAFAPTP